METIVAQFKHNCLDYDLKDTFGFSAKNYIFNELQLNKLENQSDLNKCINDAPQFSSSIHLTGSDPHD